MAQPWMKLFPADWRADPALRICSLAARGLWAEMLMLMHAAEPRGSLLVKGKAVDARMLAALVSAPENEVAALLSELENNGVFSRKKSGVIYSRRMESDENRSRKNRENGEKGGNPTLCNDDEKDKSDNPPVKPKKPEARNQTPKVSSDEDTGPTARSRLQRLLGDKLFEAVMAHRKSKRAVCSEHALGLLLGKLEKCPDPVAAADEMILRGWISVEPEWLARTKAPPNQQKTANQQFQADGLSLLNKLLEGNANVEFDGDHPTIDGDWTAH